MSDPVWDDPELKVGTMVRGALWLKQVVGEGNIFTKREIKAIFPDRSQADRRIRDLRAYGWEIHTNTQDATLSAGEQRLVHIGTPVWDKRARAAAKKTQPITGKDRQKTLTDDEYMCRTCGITGGEAYPDDRLSTAVLSVVSREAFQDKDASTTMLITQCKRCLSGSTLMRSCRPSSSWTRTGRQKLRSGCGLGAATGPTSNGHGVTTVRSLPTPGHSSNRRSGSRRIQLQ